MQWRTSRERWKRALFGHAGVALPAESDQTRNPKARTGILRSDGKRRKACDKQCPLRSRASACSGVRRMQSAVEAGAFTVLNEDRYALVALTLN